MIVLVIIFIILAVMTYRLVRSEGWINGAVPAENASLNATQNKTSLKILGPDTSLAKLNSTIPANDSNPGNASGNSPKIEFQYLGGLKDFILSYSGYIFAGFIILIFLIIILNKKICLNKYMKISIHF